MEPSAIRAKGAIVVLLDVSSARHASLASSNYAAKVSVVVERLLAYHANCSSCDLLWGYRLFDSSSRCVSLERTSLQLQPVSLESSEAFRESLLTALTEVNKNGMPSERERCGAISRTLEDLLRDVEWPHDDDSSSMDSFLGTPETHTSKQTVFCASGHQVPSSLYLFCDVPKFAGDLVGPGLSAANRDHVSGRKELRTMSNGTDRTKILQNFRRPLEIMQKKGTCLTWTDTAPFPCDELAVLEQNSANSLRRWFSSIPTTACLVHMDSLLLDRRILPFKSVMSRLDSETRLTPELLQKDANRNRSEWSLTDVLFESALEEEHSPTTSGSLKRFLRAQLSLPLDEMSSSRYEAKGATSSKSIQVLMLKGYIPSSIPDSSLFCMKAFDFAPQLLRPSGRDNNGLSNEAAESHFTGFMIDLVQRQAFAIAEAYDSRIERKKLRRFVLIQPISPILAVVREITLLNHLPELDGNVSISNCAKLPVATVELDSEQSKSIEPNNSTSITLPAECLNSFLGIRTPVSFEGQVDKDELEAFSSKNILGRRASGAMAKISSLIENMPSPPAKDVSFDGDYEMAETSEYADTTMGDEAKRKKGDELFELLRLDTVQEVNRQSPESNSGLHQEPRVERKRVRAMPADDFPPTEDDAGEDENESLQNLPQNPVQVGSRNHPSESSPDQLQLEKRPAESNSPRNCGDSPSNQCFAQSVARHSASNEPHCTSHISDGMACNIELSLDEAASRFMVSKTNLSLVSPANVKIQVRECLQELSSLARVLSDIVKPTSSCQRAVKSHIKKPSRISSTLRRAQNSLKSTNEESVLRDVWSAIFEGYEQVVWRFVDYLWYKLLSQRTKKSSKASVERLLSDIRITGEYFPDSSPSQLLFQEIFSDFFRDALCCFAERNGETVCRQDLEGVFDEFDQDLKRTLTARRRLVVASRGQGQESSPAPDATESNNGSKKANGGWHRRAAKRGREFGGEERPSKKRKDPHAVLAAARQKKTTTRITRVQLVGKGLGVTKNRKAQVSLNVTKRRRSNPNRRPDQKDGHSDKKFAAVRPKPIPDRSGPPTKGDSSNVLDSNQQGISDCQNALGDDVVVPATPIHTRRSKQASPDAGTPISRRAHRNTHGHNQVMPTADGEISFAEIPESPEKKCGSPSESPAETQAEPISPKGTVSESPLRQEPSVPVCKGGQSFLARNLLDCRAPAARGTDGKSSEDASPCAKPLRSCGPAELGTQALNRSQINTETPLTPAKAISAMTCEPNDTSGNASPEPEHPESPRSWDTVKAEEKRPQGKTLQKRSHITNSAGPNTRSRTKLKSPERSPGPRRSPRQATKLLPCYKV